MNRTRGAQVWGLLLIVAGILLLLGTMGVLGQLVAYIWALLFGVAGLGFLYVFLNRRDNWWAVIPGMALLGIGGVILVDEAAPRWGAAWSGALFLACVALAFWIIYVSQRESWWALIPAGVLTTLALVAGLSSVLPGLETGGTFFLGLGLTFLVLSVVRTREVRVVGATYQESAADAGKVAHGKDSINNHAHDAGYPSSSHLCSAPSRDIRVSSDSASWDCNVRTSGERPCG